MRPFSFYQSDLWVNVRGKPGGDACSCSARCTVCWFLLLAFTFPVAAQEKLPGITPAVELLDLVMTFHCSFDFGIPHADIAAGKADPVRVEGDVTLVPGRYGQALLTGKGGARLAFEMHGNLTLPRPGAVSLWLSPHSWKMPDETDQRGYLFFFNAGGARGGAFMIERMGFSTKIRRADRLLAGFFNFPDIASVNSGSGASRKWRNGEWHLVVVNWDRNGFALSLDGSPFQRREFRRPLTEEDFPKANRKRVFLLGYAGGEQTLIDDFVAYRRPLTQNEARKLFER